MGDQRHALHVEMDAILDGLSRDHRDPYLPHLDLRTGQVRFKVVRDEFADPDAPDEESDDERLIRLNPQRFAQVPRIEAHEEARLMQRFAATLPDVHRDALLEALQGRGGTTRFFETLDGIPDGRSRWDRMQHEARLAEAQSWLRMLGVEATWQLKRVPPVVAPASGRGGLVTRPSLLHVLLLGRRLPSKKGTVACAVDLEGEAVRSTFKHLCRQLCELKGLAWRTRFVDGKDRLEVEDMEVAVAPTGVVVTVKVSLEVLGWFDREEPSHPGDS